MTDHEDSSPRRDGPSRQALLRLAHDYAAALSAENPGYTFRARGLTEEELAEWERRAAEAVARRRAT